MSIHEVPQSPASLCPLWVRFNKWANTEVQRGAAMLCSRIRRTPSVCSGKKSHCINTPCSIDLQTLLSQATAWPHKATQSVNMVTLHKEKVDVLSKRAELT
eukprot:711077-Amphidinium_carterae.2